MGNLPKMNSEHRVLELAYMTMKLAREARLPAEALAQAIVLLEIAMVTGLDTQEPKQQLADSILNVIQYFRDEFETKERKE